MDFPSFQRTPLPHHIQSTAWICTNIHAVSARTRALPQADGLGRQCDTVAQSSAMNVVQISQCDKYDLFPGATAIRNKEHLLKTVSTPFLTPLPPLPLPLLRSSIRTACTSSLQRTLNPSTGSTTLELFAAGHWLKAFGGTQ